MFKNKMLFTWNVNKLSEEGLRESDIKIQARLLQNKIYWKWGLIEARFWLTDHMIDISFNLFFSWMTKIYRFICLPVISASALSYLTLQFFHFKE